MCIRDSFFREDFRRAYMDNIGTIGYASDAIPLYSDEFLNRVDQKAIRDASLEIVIDYAYASTSEVLPDKMCIRDSIWVSKPLASAVRWCRPWQTEDTLLASDHLPILAEFDD